MTYPECKLDDHAMVPEPDKETLKIGEGKPGPGRPPGLPNKATRVLKTAILNAFETVGGEEYLVRVAREDPKTFCTLLGNVLPTQVSGNSDNPLKTVDRVEFVIVDAGDPARLGERAGSVRVAESQRRAIGVSR